MAIPFVNLLYRYLPKHYKIAPSTVSLYLSEDLEYTPIIRNRYLLGTLTPDSTEIYYDCGDGVEIFKDSGVVKIENEYIKYNSIDRIGHKLYNLERGYFDTEVVAHCNETLWTATLSEDIDAYTTIIPFTSISDSAKIPSQGKFAIYSDVDDLEIISYSDFNQYLSGYQFTNVTRGSGTSAYSHAKDSIIEEYANLLIEQVDSIKYEKGLWTLPLATAMLDSDETADITVPFTALLDETLIPADTSIDIGAVTGTVPSQGYVLIGSEIIQYGSYTEDTTDPSNTIGTLEQCVRGGFNTRSVPHTIGVDVIFQPPPYGEFLIDNEYIHYTYYTDNGDGTGTFGSEDVPLLRGLYGTVAEAHDALVLLTERRHTELEAVGIFKIGKEYFKYWDVDDDYFYVDKRPALNAKTYYRTGTGTEFSSIIENHNIGAMISTYYFDDENTYFMDFLHTAAEHLDLAINTKADMLENFSDVDTIDIDYLGFIVKMLGEDLDDYQNLPFFTADNGDYRIRLFTKELVNIYKEKGLLSALRLWQKVISQPLESFQDLWTLNYCSFYSLPFLSLLMYEPSRVFYPNNENFFRPQISKAVQEEISEYYTGKTIRDANTSISYPMSNLKLLVHNWEYICKTDDDLKSSNGRSFDDKIVPCDTQDNLGVYYDRVNVELLVRGTSTTIPLPYYIEDYDVDLFKFEEDLDSEKNVMPTYSAECSPATFDEGFVSDYPSDWILDESSIGIYNYCNLADKSLWIRMDTDISRNLTSDISNAEIELDHNTTANENSLVVKVIDGRLYDPSEHVASTINPAIPPKGFVKFGDEIISYTGIKFYDEHTSSFIGKRYLLTGCTRGANNTTAAAYSPNVYEDNERLLAGGYVEVVYNPTAVRCLINTTTDVLTSVNNADTAIAHGFTNGDIILFDPRGSQGSPYGGIQGTWPDDAVPTYYYVISATTYTFQISTTPAGTAVNLTLDAPATCHKITFRLLLTRDPKGFGVSIGDSIHLVLANGFNQIETITRVTNDYDYCAEKYVFGIDFTAPTVLQIPTVRTDFTGSGSPSIAPTTQYNCTINEDMDTITSAAHNLSDGDIVYFLKSFSGVNAYQDYYVIEIDANTFQISSSSNPSDVIAFTNVQDTSNTYLWEGTRVISTEEGYQHRYSLAQHLLWRLDNEINANDMSLVYGMTTAQLLDKKLDTYKSIGNGIVWSTPHFKYGIDVSTTPTGLTNDGVVALLLKKIKQYKPKHTVADLTLLSNLSSTSLCQLNSVVSQENYETEYMRSDIYSRLEGFTNYPSGSPANSITCKNHDLHNADRVYIEGSPSLTFGTLYYVIYIDANTFRVSASTTGTAPNVVPGAAVAIVGTSAVHITQAPESQFRINLYPVIGDPAAKSWELPVITMDDVIDYGQSADFTYIWKAGSAEETLVYYDKFEAYPFGLVMDEPYRVRKRFLTHVE